MQPVTIQSYELGSDGMTLYVQFSDDNICSLDVGGGVTNHKTKKLIGAIPSDKWDPTITEQQKLIWVTSLYVQHLRSANSLEGKASTLSPGDEGLTVGSAAVLEEYLQSGDLPKINTNNPTPQQIIAKEIKSISGRISRDHIRKQPRRDRAGRLIEPQIYDE